MWWGVVVIRDIYSEHSTQLVCSKLEHEPDKLKRISMYDGSGQRCIAMYADKELAKKHLVFCEQQIPGVPYRLCAMVIKGE